ncbi:MAG: DUF192 domain-containing protein [Actinomycetota bacterium]|nr:DUF192 domain-containing protein [Actinomycetota bacterium]
MALGACTRAPAPEPGARRPAPGMPTATVFLRFKGGERVPVRVEVAADEALRQRGLMGRATLPPRAGMLFVYPRPHRGSFWMRDTSIPLTIAFFDRDGRILRVLDMAPCEREPCPLYDPGVAYRGALEVNRGYLDRLGAGPGWRVEVPAGLPVAS